MTLGSDSDQRFREGRARFAGLPERKATVSTCTSLPCLSGLLAQALSDNLKHDDGKLEALEKALEKHFDPAESEGFYMLAAYCFDISRKLWYVFQATKQYALEADRDLARQILADDERLEAEATWEGRAKTAERILRDQWHHWGVARNVLLREAAGAPQVAHLPEARNGGNGSGRTAHGTTVANRIKSGRAVVRK
jgi:hypothetical protein